MNERFFILIISCFFYLIQIQFVSSAECPLPGQRPDAIDLEDPDRERQFYAHCMAAQSAFTGSCHSLEFSPAFLNLIQAKKDYWLGEAQQVCQGLILGMEGGDCEDLEALTIRERKSCEFIKNVMADHQRANCPNLVDENGICLGLKLAQEKFEIIQLSSLDQSRIIFLGDSNHGDHSGPVARRALINHLVSLDRVKETNSSDISVVLLEMLDDKVTVPLGQRPSLPDIVDILPGIVISGWSNMDLHEKVIDKLKETLLLIDEVSTLELSLSRTQGQLFYYQDSSSFCTQLADPSWKQAKRELEENMENILQRLNVLELQEDILREEILKVTLIERNLNMLKVIQKTLAANPRAKVFIVGGDLHFSEYGYLITDYLKNQKIPYSYYRTKSFENSDQQLMDYVQDLASGGKISHPEMRGPFESLEQVMRKAQMKKDLLRSLDRSR